MNFRTYLAACLLLLGSLYSLAQTWSGTPTNTFTNANVGIGFATTPTLNDKLVVNGNIRLIGGLLSLSENEFGKLELSISSEDARTDNSAFGITLKGGSAAKVLNNSGYGGSILLNAGDGNSSGFGGNIYLDGGKGGTNGNVIINNYGGANVGIGTNIPSSKLHVVGNSLFEGQLTIPSAGSLSFLGSSDGPGSFLVSGQNVSGAFTSNDDIPSATNVTVKGGDAMTVTGIGGAGGSLYLYGGISSASVEGGNIYIESGQGSITGNIFMQAYQGKGGSVLIGLQKPIVNAKFAVSGNSFFEGNIQIGTLNPKPLSILEVGKLSKTYFIDDAAHIGIGWNSYKEGDSWKYSNATTPVSRIGQFENGFGFSIAKPGAIGASVIWGNVLQAKLTSDILETYIGNKESKTFVDGYLSIGGILPAKMPSGYSLAVAKGILTEKVKIASVASTEWKDLVFEEGYKLKSLADLEKFIKGNKHLPEVPSSSEVEKNGYELVQMDATLLQKIEEMTLYIIEMEKRLLMLENEKK